MEITRTTDDEQTTLWNGLAGHAWVALQDVLDQMFKPLEDLLIDAVFAGSGHRVLDVGYGTGSTTLAVMRPGGQIAIVSQPRCPGATAETTVAAGREIAARLTAAGFRNLRSDTLTLTPPLSACAGRPHKDRCASSVHSSLARK